MTDLEPELLIGLVVLFVLVFIPVFNFFADRAAKKKASEDVFHARINRLVEDVQFIKGWLKGKFDVNED